MTRLHLELEERIVDAWPPAESDDQDGWLLRASGGPSHRGNSVATLEFRGDEASLLERVAKVEAWYAARGQPAMFQIGPCVRPRQLDACLKARGYLEEASGLLASADPEEVLMRTRNNALRAHVDAQPDAAWFDAIRSGSRFAADIPGFQGFLRRLGTRCRFASVRDGSGKVIACCFGITSEESLGVYAMLTLPEARRQGAARALLHALATTAEAESMREMYLLVDRDNAPARALYQSTGFVDVFEYHYRLQA